MSTPRGEQPEQLGSRCSACGSEEQTEFFEMRNMPVNVGMLCESFHDAQRVPLGDIRLTYCHSCGFIRNRSFDCSRIAFEPGYHASLHYSPTVRSFLGIVVDGLIERFDLRGKTIVEIGCGDGYFLRSLCERGGNRGIGIDPAVVNERVEVAGAGQVRFIRDRYRESHARLECDFICCRAVFEDIAQPAEFLAMLRRGLGDRRTPVYFEVFNGLRSLECDEIWSIHYEQCNYFSQKSLNDMFEQAGFDILNCGASVNRGQYLFVEAVPRAATANGKATPKNTNVLPNLLKSLPVTHQAQRKAWEVRFKAFQQCDVRVVAWGSGAKGITFLNSFDTGTQIPYLVDINPHRQHKYVPKTGQKTVAPDFLRGFYPHVVVITNSRYEGEIRRQVRELGLNCEFQCV